jgi:lipoate-protein ligase A
MVRKIDLRGVTIGHWGAIDELMAKQMHEGKFEDTLVTIEWSEGTPSLGLGLHEDAVMVDVDLARSEGFEVGRRYAYGGGTGVHTPDTPNYLLYYQNDDTSLLAETDKSGEANVGGLERIGLDAEYSSIGDTEVVIDGSNYKVIAGAAASVHLRNYWSVTGGIVWDFSEAGTILDDAIDIPPEKFEDKDTDSLTARIQPLVSLLDEDESIDTSKREVLDTVAEANVEALLGDVPIEEAEWRPEEREFIEEMADFFQSDTWIQRRSTARMCRRVSPEYEVGVAAYKSRKLIKTSVVVDDDGRIRDSLISGDPYLRPQPTVTEPGLLDELETEIRGLEPSDEATIRETIAAVFDRPEVEVPGIDPSDVADPVARAAANAEPVPDYLARQ